MSWSTRRAPAAPSVTMASMARDQGGWFRSILRGCRATTMVSGCMDLCWVGASVVVTPDMLFYGRFTQADVDVLADALAQPDPAALGANPRLQQLAVKPEEFDEAPRPVGIGRKPR